MEDFRVNEIMEIERTEPSAPFVFGCSLAVFPADEIAILLQHGRSLEDLVAGIYVPSNRTQEHFLLVDRGGAEPQSLLERAWVRLKGRREYEAENSIPKLPEPPVDYGMVDFDFDRCWW